MHPLAKLNLLQFLMANKSSLRNHQDGQMYSNADHIIWKFLSPGCHVDKYHGIGCHVEFLLPCLLVKNTHLPPASSL